MPSHHTLRRSAAVLITLLAPALVTGCAGWDPISDPPADLEVQPLEVVVNSDTRPESPCLLNVNKVRAGEHAVSIIGMSGFARVRIVDEDDRIVFRSDNEGQRMTTNDAGEVTIHAAEGEGEGTGPAARLEAGTFTVQCRPEDGAPGEATLRVLPARAGHESSSTAP